jgi:Kef-type K+ transport system membrane component KefB
MTIGLTNLLIVAAVAFAAPLLLGLAPGLRLPAVVLELVAGIVLGPSGLGWVEIDAPVQVMALIGLAFLLFLAGLEIEFPQLRGSRLKLATAGFVASFGLALGASYVLHGIGLVDTPFFVAIVLVATSLGVVVPVLKDAGRSSSNVGQLVIAAASIADFGAVILLSLFYSRESSGTGTKVLLLGGFVVAVAAVAVSLLAVERLPRISATLLRLQDTTAQIRVRGAYVLLVGLAALATWLGLEVILGAFLAGAVLTLVDRDRGMSHPLLRTKLEATGYGVFVPAFFVTSGLRFDLDALFADTSTLVLVPIFLGVLALVRGVPALLYRRSIGTRDTLVAGLLQATSLPFIVAAAMIGIELGTLDRATGAALIAAGLLSVLLFPLAAATVLRGRPDRVDAATLTPADLPR